jgi:hypothetical protein
MGKTLGVVSLEDWYRVSFKMLSRTALISTLRQWGSLKEMLSTAYPNHSWSASKFGLAAKKSRQNQIAASLRNVLPGYVIEEDVKLTDSSGSILELDLFVPKANLALEIDGEHHFFDVRAVSQSIGFQHRDDRKYAMCMRRGITLISIPYNKGRDATEMDTIIKDLIQQVRRQDLLPPT